jgi:hypothetical protein
LTDTEYCYHCTIPWSDWAHNRYYWNDLTADAMELFGLPGDRYITDISENHMTYSFKSDKDAVIFRLKFGEFIQ